MTPLDIFYRSLSAIVPASPTDNGRKTVPFACAGKAFALLESGRALPLTAFPYLGMDKSNLLLFDR